MFGVSMSGVPGFEIQGWGFRGSSFGVGGSGLGFGV